jgi:hypothetical protein
VGGVTPGAELRNCPTNSNDRGRICRTGALASAPWFRKATAAVEPASASVAATKRTNAFVIVSSFTGRDACGTVPPESFGGHVAVSDLRGEVAGTATRAQQIRSITYDEGDLTIRHDRGKIRMRVTYDFEDLLAELMELNPGIELARTWAKELDNRLQH